jgi:transcriptional regulator with XRE-family HTH domain
MGGAQVSRYERFVREPTLETALALEVIFQRSASELFDGLYKRVEEEVMARARILSNRVDLGGIQTSGVYQHCQ